MRAVALWLATLTFVTGCGTPVAHAAPEPDAGLTRFADCDSFARHMRKVASDRLTPDGFGDRYGLPGPQLAARRYGPAPADDLGVTSVSDGVRLLASDAAKGAHVVNLTGRKPRRAGDLLSYPGTPTGLVLDGDRALVVGELGPYDTRAAPPRPGQTGTTLNLYDLSASAPRLLGSAQLSGRAHDVRTDGGAVRIVLAARPGLTFPPAGKGAAARADALARNRKLVRDSKVEDWLPVRQVYGPGGKLRMQGPAVSCQDVLRPAEPAGVGLLTVLSLDLRSPTPLARLHGDAVVADGDLAAFSPDGSRAYLATQPAAATTAVHAFEIVGGLRLRYAGTATVAGYVTDQNRMSGTGTGVRIATVALAAAAGGRRSYVVHRLDLSPDGLVAAGPGARIPLRGGLFGLQWLGDVAAVVPAGEDEPWRLVDPAPSGGPRLGAKVPALTGPDGFALEIPGNRILAFDGDGYGPRPRVVAYDVADPARPRRLDTLRLHSDVTGAASIAFLPSRSLVVFPGADVRHLSESELEADREQAPARCDQYRRQNPQVIPLCVTPGPTEIHQVVRALRVAPDGTLTLVGSYRTGEPAQHIHAARGRILVLSRYSDSVVALRAPGLARTGSLWLAEEP